MYTRCGESFKTTLFDPETKEPFFTTDIYSHIDTALITIYQIVQQRRTQAVPSGRNLFSAVCLRGFRESSTYRHRAEWAR